MALYNKHLDSFVRVIECGSFTKAAEELYLSTNALVKHINILERDLGITLLERSNQGVRATDAGAYVHEHAKQIIANSEKILREAHRLSQPKVRKVRLGISLMRPPTEVVRRWNAIQHKHPDIEVDLVHVADDFKTWMNIFLNLGDQIDVAVGVHPSPHLEWYGVCDYRDIYQTSRFCMVPIEHPLANREAITCADLEGLAVKLVTPGYSSQSDELRALLAQEHPSIIQEEYTPYDLGCFNELAREGTIAICHEDWKNIHPAFRYIPLEGVEKSTVSLIYAKDCDAAIETFVNAIADEAKLGGA